ncbi:MAG: hypothetical protein FWH01_14375 [Oscillospiraceae bacterium]|nr:hypothetical protein [Oscillospiraceae bacterium]
MAASTAEASFSRHDNYLRYLALLDTVLELFGTVLALFDTALTDLIEFEPNTLIRKESG